MGAGATAEVYLAAGPNPRGAELLALKVVLPHLAEDGTLREMILREARTSALLRHANLVEIYDVGEVEGRPYLAMEFVRGWSLSAFEKKLKAAGQRLTPSEACYLVAEAAAGLHYAHEARGRDGAALGLIHRDVSPQNLILAEDGTVKVVDFGLAKATQGGASALTGGIKGKLPYMPPEQLRAHPLDRRVDVFALGAVLWELATGSLLYPGKSEAEIFQQALFLPQPHPDEAARGLPRALVDVLQRAVEREVDKRTPSAAALAKALAPLIVPDAAAALARRVREHFEPLPRSAGEALGLPPTPTARPRAERAEEATAVDRPPSDEDATVLNLRRPSPEELRSPPPPPARVPGAKGEDYDRTLRHVPAAVLWATEPGTAPSPAAVPVPVPSEDVPTASTRRSFWRRWGPAVAIAVALPTLAVGATVAVHAGLQAMRTPTPLNEAELAQDEAKPNVAKDASRVRGKGSLVLHSDVPAFVRANGRELGMTPITVNFPSGRVKLELQTADRAKAVELEVMIVAGEQVSRRVLLGP